MRRGCAIISALLIVPAWLAASLLEMGAFGVARAGPFEDGLAAATAHDYATAVMLWRPLAEEGQPDAQADLGVLYDNGLGVVQDHVAAAALFRKAANQGHADGAYDLAVCYDLGRGTTQSATMAAYWYRKAADQGIVAAQMALGQKYIDGGTLPKDPSQAYVWFAIAAQNLPPANPSRDQALKNKAAAAAALTPAQLAEADKQVSEWRAKP